MNPGPDPRSDPREKALLCLGLLLYCFGGYYAIGLAQDPAQAASLRTPLDDALPFLPVFMWGYVVVYTMLFIPVFTVKSPRLFRRVCLAYFVVVSACLLTWLVFPVTALGLRADLSGLDMTQFHNWGTKVNYTLDPPMNLFPSLHMAIAVIAAYSAGCANRTHGRLAAFPVALVALSIVLVKQHFVADGLAGALLGAAVYALVLRPHAATSDPDSGYSWRGPATYVAVHCAFVAALYTAFLAGWAPWA